MEKDPAKRPESAAAVAEALTAVGAELRGRKAADGPTRVVPAPPRVRPAPAAARRPDASDPPTRTRTQQADGSPWPPERLVEKAEQVTATSARPRATTTTPLFTAGAVVGLFAVGVVLLSLLPSRAQPADVTIDLGGGVTMEFVRVPAGTFLAGSPADEPERDKDDETRHEVEISRPFYLGKYEVTQAQYERVTGDNPSRFKSVAGEDTRRFPVENVSWEDAVKFCDRLTAQRGTGRVFKLPTEAEWEYACRAGTTTPFHFGPVPNGKEANCYGDDPYGTAEKGPYLERTGTVGSYRPNAFGLYDMHGNVWEWCRDTHEPYPPSNQRDPFVEHNNGIRVLRGGSWSNSCRDCRAALRNRDAPASRIENVGFRASLRLD